MGKGSPVPLSIPVPASPTPGLSTRLLGSPLRGADTWPAPGRVPELGSRQPPGGHVHNGSCSGTGSPARGATWWTSSQPEQGSLSLWLRGGPGGLFPLPAEPPTLLRRSPGSRERVPPADRVRHLLSVAGTAGRRGRWRRPRGHFSRGYVECGSSLRQGQVSTEARAASTSPCVSSSSGAPLAIGSLLLLLPLPGLCQTHPHKDRITWC